MALRGRVERLETEAAEVKLRRRAEELAPQLGMGTEEALANMKRIQSRIELLKVTHPLPVAKGKVDIEPHLRILAEEEGLDPEKVVEAARRLIERLGASRS